MGEGDVGGWDHKAPLKGAAPTDQQPCPIRPALPQARHRLAWLLKGQKLEGTISRKLSSMATWAGPAGATEQFMA